MKTIGKTYQFGIQYIQNGNEIKVYRRDKHLANIGFGNCEYIVRKPNDSFLCKVVGTGTLEVDLEAVTSELIKHRILGGSPRVWFNKWFSSIAHTLKYITEKIPESIIIGTNTSEYCTYKTIVDIFDLEPNTGDGYVEWALDFCRKNEVDIFFPLAHAHQISTRLEDFRAVGVEVIVEDTSTINTFESKDATYQLLRSKGYDKIPEYDLFNSVTEFIETYPKYAEEHRVCIKFDKDVGGSSFRVISPTKATSYKSLKSPLSSIIDYDTALKILTDMDEQNKFRKMLMMEYLDGPEVSIDCYNTATGKFIAIPRFKHSGRVQVISFKKEIIEEAEKINNLCKFNAPYNIQFRWRDNKPVLLEINTRMSGGIHLATTSGVSIPLQIISDRFSLGVHQGTPKEHAIIQYETPIILE